MADARRRADQLGDDHVGPGPAEHEAQDLGDRRRTRRDQHARDDAPVLGTERVGSLHQVAPGAGDGHRHHQDELEHRADEDHEQLLRLADARPQDQQRNEGGGRQVARERHEGFEEGFDGPVRAHQDAERDGDERRQHEAPDHAPNRHADVVEEAVLDEELVALADHGERVGEERAGHVAAERRPRPQRHEHHEKQYAEADARGIRNRLHGAEHQRYSKSMLSAPLLRT